VSWSDVRELVYDVVNSYAVNFNSPYELHELEDYLLDYAGGLSEEVLSLHQIQNALLHEALQFDIERWCRMIDEEERDCYDGD
jgi:hypothetical protein